MVTVHRRRMIVVAVVGTRTVVRRIVRLSNEFFRVRNASFLALDFYVFLMKKAVQSVAMVLPSLIAFIQLTAQQHNRLPMF